MLNNSIIELKLLKHLQNIEGKTNFNGINQLNLELKKSAVRKRTVQKSSYFYSCNLVRETKLHKKREILLGDPAFQNVLSDTSVLKYIN